MSVISWSPLFESGDPTIDAQHKSLVETINRLNTAQTWGTGRHAMAFVLDELDSYAKVHFGTEERFFDEVAFPKAEEHRASHHFFAEQIIELRKQFEGGDEASVSRLLELLGDWLVRHVANEDVLYRPYLAKRA
ncbi:MAG TPA: hemerythrin family protein [Rectinemataceae bacterium]|nr:hemerythrin family protein [Rectinemataceae bacterium]